MLIARVRGVVVLALVACTLAAGLTALASGPPDEPTVAARADDAKPSGPVEALAVTRFEGHTDGVMVVAFSPDGKRALSGGVCYGDRDPTVRLWDVATGKELKRYEGHEGTVYGLDVSGDGKLLLTGGVDSTVRLWNLETGKEVRRFEGHTDKVRAVAFSADGKQAVSGGLFSDPTVRVWEVESGRELSRYLIETAGDDRDDLLKFGGFGGFGGLRAARGRWMSGVSSVAFSPDGKLVLAGGMDNVLHLFQLSDGKERKLEGHEQQLHGAVFTPDGKRILSGSYDKTVRLWDVESGKEVCRFFGHTNWVWGVAVSADGKLGLSGSLDKTVRLWKLPK
jgi:WD40 repeat protein